VNLVDDVREVEEVMKDRRGDVVGKIAVDADAAAGSDGGDVCFKNVAGDDGEIGELSCEAAKSRDERRIDFDGVDRSATGEKVLRDFTMAGSNFDPAMLIVPRKRNGGMRRNANGERDLFAPVEIGKEVLAEALACHGGNSVPRGARCAPRGKEVRR